MSENRDTKDVTLAVISNQIDNLKGDVKEAIELLRVQNGRVRLLENEFSVIRSERIADRLKALEEQALPVVRSLKWVAAITGGLLIALLWQIFIGNVKLSP